MLVLRWDDGTITTVDRRRTVGSDPACDTTLDGLAEVQLIVEEIGRWALVEDVSTGSGATLEIDGAAVTGRVAIDVGAQLAVGRRTGQVVLVAAEHAADGLLTDRQLDVLACFGDGNTAEDAADRLGLSPSTVNSHVQAAYRRLDVSSRAAALGVLFARGIFPDRRSGATHPDGLYAGVLASRVDEQMTTIVMPPDFASWEQMDH